MAEMAIHIIEYCDPMNLFTNAKKKKKKKNHPEGQLTS